MKLLLLLTLAAPTFAGDFEALSGLSFADFVGQAPSAPPSTASKPAGRFEVTPYDRSSLSRGVLRQTEERRAALIKDYEDPRVARFSIPKTKAFVQRVVDRLFAGSGLEGRIPPVVVQVNDSSWGRPAASCSAGILSVDPELVSIMASEDEVAAVLAHELAHHVRAHDEQLAKSARRFPSLGGGGIFSPPQPSKRELEARWRHEFEADDLGQIILANAGYDPAAAPDALLAVGHEIDTEPHYAFERRPDPNHPSMKARVDELRRLASARALTHKPRLSLDGDVFRECAGRHRPGDSTTADQLLRHYGRIR